MRKRALISCLVVISVLLVVSGLLWSKDKPIASPQSPTTNAADAKGSAAARLDRAQLLRRFINSCQCSSLHARVKLYESSSWSFGTDARKKALAADVSSASLIGVFDFTQRLNGEFELAYRPKGKSNCTWSLVRFTAPDGRQRLFEQAGQKKTAELTPSQYVARCLAINPWGENETLRPKPLWSCGILEPLRTSWLGTHPEEGSIAAWWRCVIQTGDLEGRRTSPVLNADGDVVSKWRDGSEQLTRLFLDPVDGRVVEAHNVGLVANVPGMVIIMAWTFEYQNQGPITSEDPKKGVERRTASPTFLEH